MGYNKIPLALRYNDTTNNAEGLIEFQLNLSDVGDVCDSDTSPNPGDVLTYDTANRCWKASATPAVAAGALSALTDICDGVTSVTQYQALVWNGTEWCPSTIPTGGGTPTLPAGDPGDLLINDSGTTYLASAASDAGIMQLDPYFGVNDDGKIAVWDGSQLTAEYPDRLFIRVEAAETLVAGDVVYVVDEGPNDNTVRVAKAQANSSTTMPAIGMVFDGIDPNQVGTVISFGKSSPVSVGTVAVGTTVYVDPTTAGGFTTTKPNGSTDLIQNIGFVAASGENGIVKLTGVGRSNDIPINVDVVGSATIGTNEFTQTTAKLAGTTANEIVITDPTTNLINSVTSATLLSNYYTQAQADAAFIEDSTSSINPPNLSGTITNGQLIKRSSSTQFAGVTTTSQSEAFLGTQANLGDLTDVSVGGATAGQSLVYDPEEANAWIASTVGTGAGFVDGPTVSATFSSIEVDDLKVNRIGGRRPTSHIHFTDFLCDNVQANGFNQSQRNGGQVTSDGNYAAVPSNRVVGMFSIRTQSDSNGGATLHTGQYSLSPSAAAFSMTARLTMSTLHTSAGYANMGWAHRRAQIAEATNGIWFSHDETSNNWLTNTGNGTSVASKDTGVGVSSLGNFQVLQIMCNEDWTKAEFFIDGDSVGVHLLSTATDYFPTTWSGEGSFYYKNQNTGTTTDSRLQVDWSLIEITHTASDRGESYIKKAISAE